MTYKSVIRGVLGVTALYFVSSAAVAEHDDVICRAYDKGWEEHRNGHPNCKSCLGRHGRCIKRCYTVRFECVAEGTGSSGYPMRFKGEAANRRAARNEALDNCRFNDGRGCRITGCKTVKEPYSKENCRAPSPHPPRAKTRCETYPIGCGPGYKSPKLRGVDCKGRSEIGCLCWQGLGGEGECEKYRRSKGH